MRADESVRPAQPADVVPAGRAGAELLIHFLECLRVINSRHRMPQFFHIDGISPFRGGMKGIPIFEFYRPIQAGLKLDTGSKRVASGFCAHVVIRAAAIDLVRQFAITFADWCLGLSSELASMTG
jgi:hypothetical protein